MALIKVKFNEDIGSLVNTKDNTVFNGRRVSGVINVRNESSQNTADNSRNDAKIKLKSVLKKYHADAYELLAESSLDECQGQEYMLPSYTTEMSVILYQKKI